LHLPSLVTTVLILFINQVWQTPIIQYPCRNHVTMIM